MSTEDIRQAKVEAAENAIKRRLRAKGLAEGESAELAKIGARALAAFAHPAPAVCGVSNPGGQPCTKPKGHPKGHDDAVYGPPQPAPDAGGEWRVSDNNPRDVMCGHDYIAIATSKKHATRIVSDHTQAAAVPKLVEALIELAVRAEFSLTTPGFIRDRRELQRATDAAKNLVAAVRESTTQLQDPPREDGE